ncbi:viroplasmin family protein [Clostridium rectalis]|uniref:ribonuclease H1 domain-containing protein n=1 Tax=Clostridium rectalis TaxID=2040295 RepID=UPI000F638904|nr:ribonuclease H family protein [Clostridium rectalis]
MGKKVYAIKLGFDFENNKKIENIIVSSWNECLKYVKGVKGAAYKSFFSREEAEKFLNSKNKLLKKGVDEYPLDIMHAYVDGSFNAATEKYSYAYVIVKNDVILYAENGVAEDNSKKDLRQIAGELKAAVKSAEYAVDKKERKLVLFHDYEGICHHATGQWERREKSSEKYFNIMNDFMKNKNLNIIFVKVDSHTGDIYNEIVDELAKLAAGVTVPGVVKKLLKREIIKVLNNEVKEKIMKICPEYHQNIQITNHCQNHGEGDNIIINDKSFIKITNIIKNLIQESEESARQYINTLDPEVKDELLLNIIKCR